MSQVVNITRIIFDRKLKDFILYLKRRFSSEIDYLSELESASCRIYKNKSGQQFFRDYFKDSKDQLNFLLDTPRMNKCDIFALFACLIIDIENLNEWTDVFNTANVDDVSGNQLEPEEGEHNKRYQYTCACGQQIMDICMLYSPVTTCGVVVGNCCVKKNLICNPGAQLYVKAAEKKKRQAIYEQKSRAKQQLNFRQCVDCSAYNIKKTDPHWKIRCYSCWKKPHN